MNPTIVVVFAVVLIYLLWRRWRARQGDVLGSYDRLPEFVGNHAPGKSFADIGCMWGVNGSHAFLAEDAGATRVVGVDVFGPTPEFERAPSRLKAIEIWTEVKFGWRQSSRTVSSACGKSLKCSA